MIFPINCTLTKLEFENWSSRARFVSFSPVAIRIFSLGFNARSMEVETAAYDVLLDTRRAIEEIAAKLLFVKKMKTKNPSPNNSKSELKEFITEMSLLFITLRKVNRVILLDEDRAKVQTDSLKAKLDFASLQFHNLMYEKNHYVKAIKNCKNFKSKNLDIDLVPEEEFFSSAPEDIKGKALANDSHHHLMLRRLTFELFQRKELCKLQEKLEQRKGSLLETIANRKKFLSSLPSQLKYLKKLSLPVQQQLGILDTQKLKQHIAADLLPPPLYIVYSQLLAQKEAFGERIELEIVGSVKDAQTFAQHQANNKHGMSSNTENSKLVDDKPHHEDGQRRSKRAKKGIYNNLNQTETYQLHPLNVSLVIYEDEDSDAKPSKLITLRFEYLVKLNVICVGIDDAEEGCDCNILCNLFPSDTGMELPHQMAKLYAGEDAYFNEESISRPYMWAQHLGGIYFLPELPPLHESWETPNSEVPLKGGGIHSGISLYRLQNRVQTVVQRIRSRIKARMSLV